VPEGAGQAVPGGSRAGAAGQGRKDPAGEVLRGAAPPARAATRPRGGAPPARTGEGVVAPGSRRPTSARMRASGRRERVMGGRKNS
jgi:hypothetical protein